MTIKSKKEEVDVDFRFLKQKHRQNPFVYQNDADSDKLEVFDIEKNIKIKKKFTGKDDTERGIVDINTGDIIGGMGIYEFKKMDTEPFVKFYIKNMSVIFELSGTAQKCLYGICSLFLKPNSDKVYIDFTELYLFLNYKDKQMVYKGMRELYLKEFIAPAVSTGWWFINPLYFFNGDRIVLMGVYQKNDNNNGKKQQLQGDSSNP
jgi:hypothetical protein